MKISASKKQLAKIISENGGWSEGAGWAIQGRKTMGVGFSKSKPYRKGDGWFVDNEKRMHHFVTEHLIHNWHQTALHRDEYFYLHPEPDSDGWIVWNGGECPVERGTLIDVKHRNKEEYIGVPALGRWNYAWLRSGINPDDIIAYRLHKPEYAEQEYPDGIKPIDPFKQEPTIEQLAADYRAKLAIAQQAQEEADSYRCGAEAALKLLELAGAKLGLVIGVCETQKQEAELNITDWRDLKVGDIIWCEAEDEYVQAGEKEVLGIEIPGYYGTRAIRVLRDGGRSYWINTDLGWHFIRRP